MSAQIIPLTAKEVPRWQFLAWAIANAQPGGDFMMALQCMFNALSPADQAHCRAEVAECKRAIRGEVVAVVTRWPDGHVPDERTHHLEH